MNIHDLGPLMGILGVEAICVAVVVGLYNMGIVRRYGLTADAVMLSSALPFSYTESHELQWMLSARLITGEQARDCVRSGEPTKERVYILGEVLSDADTCVFVQRRAGLVDYILTPDDPQMFAQRLNKLLLV